MTNIVNRVANSTTASSIPETNCKICGAHSYVEFSLPSNKRTGRPIPEETNNCHYYRCSECDFLFATIHDQRDNSQIYGSAYWAEESGDKNASVAQSLRLVLLANSLVNRPPYELNILDFGCGLGGFVEIARTALNLRVWGTDINRPKWGGEYYFTGDPPELFDIINAVEVVEHLPTPIASFTAMKRMLKPGGAIAFQTAYYDRNVCDRNWWYLGPANGHISLYSEEALNRMYSALGGIRRMSWSGYPGLQAWQFP